MRVGDRVPFVAGSGAGKALLAFSGEETGRQGEMGAKSHPIHVHTLSTAEELDKIYR